MTDQEWLDQIKAGDKVFISNRFGAVPSEGTVSRRTKTRIFIVTGQNWAGNDIEEGFRLDGRLVGGDAWTLRQIIRPTDELGTRIELAKLTVKARSLHESVVFPKTKDELLQLIANLEKYQPAKPCQ